MTPLINMRTYYGFERAWQTMPALPVRWYGAVTRPRSAETIFLRGTRTAKPDTNSKARAAPATPAYMHTAYFQIEATLFGDSIVSSPKAKSEPMTVAPLNLYRRLL